MNYNGKDRRKRTKGRLIVGSIVLLIMGLSIYLTHDILITNFLAYRICHSDPQPKTFVKKTVEYPESIYFEDNIYPGFDEKDRLLMIRNYLDGIHLKTLGLNAPDGKVFLYSATAIDWKASSMKLQEIKSMNKEYFKILDKEAKEIAERAKIVTRDEMSKLNYMVVFNPVKLTALEAKYLYSDEVIITNNQTGEVIGYNRRLMRFWYTLFPDVAFGIRYYYPHAICGFSSVIGFPYKIFPYLIKIKSGAMMESYNSKLYRKYNGEDK